MLDEAKDAREAVAATIRIIAVLALGASPLLASRADAEIAGFASNGFEVREQVHVSAGSKAVYAALTTPKRWWASDHTYSRDATRLTLDPRAGGCWCERLPDGGSVQHLTVVYAAPEKALRLRGALGPLQAMGVAGSLTISLKEAGEGTDVTLTYAVGGYAHEGFETLAKTVDGVLSEQLARLKRLLETGSPESAKP